MTTSDYSTGYTVPYTGNQALIRHKQLVNKEKYIIRQSNERLKVKPALHDATPERLAMARSVYGVRLQPIPKQIRMYDRINKLQPDWDPKVKHDAYRNLRQHMINARTDEEYREIPILANSEPGHRLNAPPEPFSREHARIMVFHGSVYRNNGIQMTSNIKL